MHRGGFAGLDASMGTGVVHLGELGASMGAGVARCTQEGYSQC